MQNKDETIYIKLAQAGDVKAFEKLVGLYERQVMALAVQLLGNTEDAKDLYQDVFIKVYKNLHRFRFESQFFTWLYRIVINSAYSMRKKRSKSLHASIDEIRNENNEYGLMPPDNQPSPEKKTILADTQAALHASLDTLPLQQRVAFILRFFEEFKINEIAEIMNCAEGTVKNYLFRSTQKIKKIMKPYI